MLPINSWGDPYADDDSGKSLLVGDMCKVKLAIPITGGMYGQLREITTDGTRMVKLENGRTMGYDADMLVKVRDPLR